MDLPLAFAALAALVIVFYVLLDGFDLGIGILFLAAPRDRDRDLMMESVEPVWDGNETWLVMGGTLLFAAFPAAYYILLPAFYLPVMMMLFGLVARGVAFGFRGHATRLQVLWDWAFSGGSVLAVLGQGFVLGGFIGGVPVADGMFAGGTFGSFTPLGALCGLGLLGGYALLGAGWIIWRTDGPTQAFARGAARGAIVVVAVMMALVSAWTATIPEVRDRWFAWPNVALLAPVPLVTAAVVVAVWRAVPGPDETRPFLLGIGLFLLGFLGLIVSLWPFVVPRSVTVWDGAADPQTLAFIGVGLVLVLPVVVTYQAYAYRVFRGKVGAHPEG
ncbi:cytochrome d ubiquinol oxidase subunit II [Salinarimonas soli]|uniref:Cytochrome d ubiquinol oxidase subunit II n=1 Tax=Salinarimonas soli TaxID=1638099 RepID=A0A5B2VEI7_9HYPH|nr:cytochrome d ubiquinol oxidase subunit II [Salinarimonas soli]KAA2236587.1 cytochrome d ubiquinol oxidase subunit II [Salinarimonas soli]